MNSSVKFLAPSVSDLPLPGWPLGALAPVLEPEELFLSEPQAARPTASATASSATIVRYHVLLVITSLPVVVMYLRAPIPSLPRRAACRAAPAASPIAAAARPCRRRETRAPR